MKNLEEERLRRWLDTTFFNNDEAAPLFERVLEEVQNAMRRHGFSGQSEWGSPHVYTIDHLRDAIIRGYMGDPGEEDIIAIDVRFHRSIDLVEKPIRDMLKMIGEPKCDDLVSAMFLDLREAHFRESIEAMERRERGPLAEVKPFARDIIPFPGGRKK